MYAPHVLPAASDYDALCRAFRWQVPAQYNIGVDVCDRWAKAEPGRIALFHVNAHGAVEEISYGELRENSNRLANALAGHGIVARRSRCDPAAAGAGSGRRRTSLSTSSVRSPCRWRSCSGTRRSPIACRIPARAP